MRPRHDQHSVEAVDDPPEGKRNFTAGAACDRPERLGVEDRELALHHRFVEQVHPLAIASAAGAPTSGAAMATADVSGKLVGPCTPSCWRECITHAIRRDNAQRIERSCLGHQPGRDAGDVGDGYCGRRSLGSGGKRCRFRPRVGAIRMGARHGSSSSDKQHEGASARDHEQSSWRLRHMHSLVALNYITGALHNSGKFDASSARISTNGMSHRA